MPSPSIGVTLCPKTLSGRCDVALFVWPSKTEQLAEEAFAAIIFARFVAVAVPLKITMLIIVVPMIVA